MHLQETYWRAHNPEPSEKRMYPLTTITLAGVMLSEGDRFFEYGEFGEFARLLPGPVRRSVGAPLGHYSVFSSLNAEEEAGVGYAVPKLDHYGIVRYGILLNRDQPHATCAEVQERIEAYFLEDLATATHQPEFCRRQVTQRYPEPIFLWSRMRQEDDRLRRLGVERTWNEIGRLAGFLTVAGEFVPVDPLTGNLVLRLRRGTGPVQRVEIPVPRPYVAAMSADRWGTLDRSGEHPYADRWQRHPVDAMQVAEDLLRDELAAHTELVGVRTDLR